MRMRGREDERSRQGPYFGGDVDEVKYKGKEEEREGERQEDTKHKRKVGYTSGLNYEIKLLSISSFLNMSLQKH